jgi:hypothetical protein
MRVGGHITKAGTSIMMDPTLFHHDKCSAKEGWSHGGASNRACQTPVLKLTRSRWWILTWTYSHSNGLMITFSSTGGNKFVQAASAYSFIESMRLWVNAKQNMTIHLRQSPLEECPPIFVVIRIDRYTEDNNETSWSQRLQAGRQDTVEKALGWTLTD